MAPFSLIMPFFTYILQSETTGRYYCGSTGDLNRRVKQHNDPEYHGSMTTKRFKGPWKITWFKEFPSRSEAMFLEKKIKKRGIKRYLDDRHQAESRRRRD